jgi:16S rRNA processing protein RimM
VTKHDQLVVVGTIIKPHGILGEVVVEPYTDSPGVFEDGARLVLTSSGSQPHPCRVRTCRAHQGRWLVGLEGIQSRTEAEPLRNHDLCTEIDSLAPLAAGECYVFEVVGATVLAADGSEVGSVQSVAETAAGHILEIRTPETVFYLPFVDEYVQEIRRGDAVVVIRNYEGLRDLEWG